MSELRERELRDLLERVSAIDGEVDVDEHWVAGRRRRTRRGVGIAVVTGAVAVAAVGAVAQTGLLGGSGTTPTGPAAVPDELETFVFAAPDVTGPVDTAAELSVATADGLAGTRWELQEGMWNASTAATDLTGTTAQTVLSFADEGEGAGWGISVDGCGEAGVQSLQLDERGRFVDPSIATTDIGCPEDVQAAEDFWIESLAGGGQLTLLGDGQWLLLSVEAPAPETPEPTTDPQPAPTTSGEDEAPTGEGTAAPAEDGAAAPTADGTTEPTDEGTSEPTTAPSTTDPGTGAPPAPPGQEFVEPGQESVDQPWPDGGGQLFAPTVRAGVHEGFDRVVVDLTGAGDPGWRAAYTDDPRLDGSGFASDIAGDSVLELRLSGMAYPEPGSDVYSEGVFGLDTHTLDAVVEVQRTAPFEGMLQVFVGMEGDPRPYRVFLLQDPMRLVIDVRTDQ